MGLRTPKPTTPKRSPRDEPVAVVDTALSLASRRQLYTTAEARELLEGVTRKVHNQEMRGVLASIVRIAEEPFATSQFVERSEVVDRLLDMRLAVTD
jgi:hypothetical protein